MIRIYCTLALLTALYAMPNALKWLPVVGLLGVVAFTPARGRR